MAEEVLTIDDETGFKDDIEDLERPLLQQNNVLAETSPFKVRLYFLGDVERRN